MAGNGGAWKVAFADFMTAMMALFLVLWISAQDKKILIATSQYFQNPFNSPMDNTAGVLPFNADKTTNNKGENEGETQNRDKQIEMSMLNAVAADFQRLLHIDNDMADKPIDIQVTSDGLKVTLFDRAKRPLFTRDSAELTEWGRFVTQSLAWMIDRHRFDVTIDGHTRKGYVPKSAEYGAWELSSDRANATRRSLVHYAVDPDLIDRVTGYADTHPLPDEKPESESNERITMSLKMTRRKNAKPTKAAVAPPSLPPPPGPAKIASHP